VVTDQLAVDRFVPIYRALGTAGTHFVIIGGQACALWAKQYDEGNPSFDAFRPYVTKDLDLCATGKNSVAVAAKALDLPPHYAPKGSASPEMGVLRYLIDGRPVPIQILWKGYHVTAKEIIEREQRYLWKDYGLELAVMHPIHCLEDKAAALCGLNQTGRQDRKHLRMALRFVPLFITERLTDSAPRQILGMCQRLMQIAEGEIGLKCYLNHRLCVEKAIPVKELRASGVGSLQNFVAKEYKRRLTNLRELRKGSRRDH